VRVQRPLASTLTEIYQEACAGSTMDKGPPLIRFELRQRAFPQVLGAQALRVVGLIERTGPTKSWQRICIRPRGSQ
jgi:hypothetical protein